MKELISATGAGNVYLQSFMSYILHIDTSAETGIVVLAQDGELIAVKEQANARNHAATINNDIDSLLEENNIGLPDIAAFCVNGGPGSYTGLRIGLATAKGYCYALDKPLMMHNRLLLLSLGGIYDTANTASVYMSVLQAREGEYFVAAYDKAQNTVLEPQHIDTAGIARCIGQFQGKLYITGHTDASVIAAFADRDIAVNNTTLPDTHAWIQYAFEEYNCNRIVSLAHVEPFYLKQVYTHKPKDIK